ncbi:DEAD/DEAH box helicase [Rhizorhabdus dicambivorans]|uniref:Helicase n=1 Tax=Rhizorhabdus dicambivorans TaxID=1850238 RepID=A0A2A4FUZ7_9SPHN|nr:DEAD/DEAH box helicase [Rhizorhabdus dicambivorans]ATE66061.1 helicase [Rhizorhabdus dicambivorans]PCE41984.1 helicase [Rhizorhabdus dicambivorans]
MFDPVTIDLISRAPPLGDLDFSELPQRFTNAFAEIVAARVRLRGVASLEQRGEAVTELLAEMGRLAAAQELLVATAPERADRASAAFVAGTALQLCLMAETVVADGAPRFSSINAIHADHDICATLLFLIADSQSDAAEMAKRLKRPDGDLGAEGRLVTAIGNLASGRLREVIASQVDEENFEFYDPPSDTSASGVAVEALLRRLHAGVIQLARELLVAPREGVTADTVPESRRIFAQVRDLSIAAIDDVFDEEGPQVFSAFPGPLHVAKLLLAVSGDLVEAALCRVPAPDGVDPGSWWQIIRRAARKRPYLWRNHREALEKGYLAKGVSAAVSFPTGGGKSTLAELKIAAALLGGGQVVVLAPTLALVDQTAFTLGNAFKDYTVFGDLDDEITFSDVLELPEIIVTTPERCLVLQSIQPEAFAEVALVVFDECHLLHPRESDRSRRSIDAMLCILNLTSYAPHADLLLVSAMMQNAGEMAGWVAELTGRPCLPLDLAWKPTRQARGCVAYEDARITELHELLATEQLTATTKGVPKHVASRLDASPFAFFCLRQTWATRSRDDYALMALLDDAVPFATGVSEKSGEWYMTPNGNVVAGTIAAAAAEDGLKTLTFVQSTVAAESTVRHFRSLLPKRRVVLNEEEQSWRKLVEEEMGGPQHCYLKLDTSGQVDGSATSHHGQLLKPERMLHESLFKRRDGVDALFATSTLAQGMNLPSDVVLIAGDSRWDVSDDKFKQLDAHELLNAAGRAGRAGEGGQGFVLVVPSKIINIDDDDNTINRHWMSLQSIFSQSDQCLKIDDPITGLLDRIHMQTHDGNEDYFLARLPVGEDGTPDEPAKAMIRRSFAAYRKRQEGKAEWIESRIDAALARREELAPKKDLTWLERVAASAGLPYEVVTSLAELIEAGAFDGDSTDCMNTLFDWVEAHPAWLMHLIRPNDIEGLFGKDYRAIAGNAAKAKVALPQIRPLLTAWMAGKPLCELERAIGTKEHLIKTCETARHFAVRLVPDLAFVAGLPARILAAKAVAAGEEPAIPIVLQTLSGVVRKGCASPEQLANAVHLKSESRPSARARFAEIQHYISASDLFASFESVLDRVRQAHAIAMFDDL